MHLFKITQQIKFRLQVKKSHANEMSALFLTLRAMYLPHSRNRRPLFLWNGGQGKKYTNHKD